MWGESDAGSKVKSGLTLLVTEMGALGKRRSERVWATEPAALFRSASSELPVGVQLWPSVR